MTEIRIREKDLLRVLEEHERLVSDSSGENQARVYCACLDTFTTAQDHRRHILTHVRQESIKRRTVDDALLKSVARAWRKAPEGDRRRAVAEAVQCSRASAGAYIAKARQRGFIPPAQPRTR